MSRRIPTNPDTTTWTLSHQQETAVDLLASGKTVTDTAIALELSRQTVSEWSNRHPGFQAALHSRREELWAGASDTLRGLLPRAVEVLTEALEGEHQLKAAVVVLRACGLYGLQPPAGPTDPEDLRIAEEDRQGRQRLKALTVSPF